MFHCANFALRSYSYSRELSFRLCSGQRRTMASSSASRRLRVGIGQMTSTNNVEENFNVCEGLISDAVSQSVRLFCLPECFDFIGTSMTESRQVAEPLTGPLMTRYRGLAKKYNLWLSLGGFHEAPRTTDDDRVSNTHVVINPEGEFAAVYRKIHMFDIDIPGGVRLLESSGIRPGNDIVTCDIPAADGGEDSFRLGVTTCYDVRFPVLYDKLFKAGANALLMPSAFTTTTGPGHWEVLMRARAIETQSYVIAAAQVGKHNEKRTSYGYGIIVDPWGTVMANCGLRTNCIAVADLDLDYVDQLRRNMPIANHQRDDVYEGSVLANHVELK